MKSVPDKLISILIVGGMTAAIIVTTAFNLSKPDARMLLILLTAFSAVMGVLSTVLAANGSIFNFLFGLLDVCVYSYVLYDNGMPAQLALHLLYLLPMEFVGFFKWRKLGATAKEKVKARRLSLKGALWVIGGYLLIFVAMWWASYFITKGQLSPGDPIPLPKTSLDAAITAANIMALILMSFAYLEQWYLWTLVNVCSIAIWTATIASEPASAYTAAILIKYIFYFVNGLNGIRIWFKLSAKDGNLA